MKVLLTCDVDALGWVGDVVDAADGYARNYLLPQGLAVEPTDANVKAWAAAKAAAAEKRKAVVERLAQMAEALQGAEAVVTARANPAGHLFGSVAVEAVIENLRSQGYQLPDETTMSTGRIKEVGTHNVTLKLDRDTSVDMNVVVVPESTAADAAEAEAAATTPGSEKGETSGENESAESDQGQQDQTGPQPATGGNR